MKKRLLLPVVFMILPTISFANANVFSEQAEASTGENYFPFHVGNQWTYTDGTKELTFSIIGTQEINGHTYYKFDDYFSAGLGGDGQTMGTEVLLRYDTELDAVLMYFHFRGEDVDITRYNFGVGPWPWWVMAGQSCRFKQRGVTCDVPAGQFSDCTNFQFLGYDAGPDCYGYGEYLAPGVGCVKYVVPGGACFGTAQKEGDLVTFQLQSYKILPSCGDPDHPYPVGDLNHDCRVDMLDLAILSSHWLQDNTPLNSNSVVKDGIEYYMETDKAVYDLGEQVEILYRVTNRTEIPMEIVGILNCYYAADLVITDADNMDIWEYHRVIPPCGWTTLHLEAHESKEYQKTWNMMNDNGTLEPGDDFPIGPGSYHITGELELSGGYQRVPVALQIEIIT